MIFNNLSLILPDLYYFILFCNQIFYLGYRGVLLSFSQGDTGVPCPTLFVFLAPFLSRLPTMPVVVGGGGQVYAWD